jgi:hypothetical protein
MLSKYIHISPWSISYPHMLIYADPFSIRKHKLFTDIIIGYYHDQLTLYITYSIINYPRSSINLHISWTIIKYHPHMRWLSIINPLYSLIFYYQLITIMNPLIIHWSSINHPFTIWLFNIAMENPNHKWRYLAGKIIYFYGPWLPWLC